MDVEVSRKRAKELIAQAEGEQGTFFLWRSKDNFSSAANHYKEAGVQLKIAKDFRQSADLFIKASEIYLSKCEDKMNAAICFSEAGLVLKQVDSTDSVKYYSRSAELYQIMGRAGPAAKIWDEVAVIYDSELFDRGSAINSYISSGDCYRSTKSETSANSEYIKAANLMASDARYLDAVKLFEQISDYYSRQATMPHHVNNCCYKALLCSLVHEVKNEQKGKLAKSAAKLTQYTTIYPTFEDNDDARLISEIIQHYEANDVEAFQNSLNKRKYKLDQMAIDMLIIIKRAMEGSLTVANNGENDGTPAPTSTRVAKREQFEQPLADEPTAAETVAIDLL
jgi:alpha-soluble NSF attachment protein